MQSDSVEPFLDNWTYLRTELAWLDRVLGLAIARHRKEAKEIERFAHSRVDRITSHWWKGLVSLEETFPATPRRDAAPSFCQSWVSAAD